MSDVSFTSTIWPLFSLSFIIMHVFSLILSQIPFIADSILTSSSVSELPTIRTSPSFANALFLTSFSYIHKIPIPIAEHSLSHTFLRFIPEREDWIPSYLVEGNARLQFLHKEARRLLVPPPWYHLVLNQTWSPYEFSNPEIFLNNMSLK